VLRESADLARRVVLLGSSERQSDLVAAGVAGLVALRGGYRVRPPRRARPCSCFPFSLALLAYRKPDRQRLAGRPSRHSNRDPVHRRLGRHDALRLRAVASVLSAAGCARRRTFWLQV